MTAKLHNFQTYTIKLKKLIAITFLTLLVLALLTRTWYITNFLNIEILCSDIDRWFVPSSSWSTTFDKPVIYLYPKEEQSVKVQLNYNGELIATYPEYNDTIKGWEVIAYPDGKIINSPDNKEYSYLFWEWKSTRPIHWNLSEGFIVKWTDTREFLQNILSKMWLTPKEYNEFIVYWYPLMKDNKYNLIHFADKQYTQTAPLIITPKPDSILRIFMVYQGIDEYINIIKQEIKPFERKWFTVIEWGGTKIKKNEN